MVLFEVKGAKRYLYNFKGDKNIVYLKPEKENFYSIIAVNIEEIIVSYFQVDPDQLWNENNNDNENKFSWLSFNSLKTDENVLIGKKIQTINLHFDNYSPDTPFEGFFLFFPYFLFYFKIIILILLSFYYYFILYFY